MYRPALRYWCKIGESFRLLEHLLPGLCPILRRNPTPKDDTLCHAQENKQNPTCLEHTEKGHDYFASAVIMGASLRVPTLELS